MEDRQFELLKEEMAATRAHFDEVAGDLHERFEVVSSDLRRHFDVVAEGMRGDVQLLAEGLAATREELAGFRVEMRGELNEVRALIRYPCTDLDRRCRGLEDTVGDLGQRVERLEQAS